MMEQKSRPANWSQVIVLVAIAAALGFGAAYWLTGRNRPAAAAAAPQAQANAKADANIVVPVPAEYLAAAKISVEPVATGSVTAELLAPGAVTAQPNSEAVVVARAAGNVTRITRQLGDKVRAGETLAEVESQDAAAMAAERSATAAKLDLARKEYQRESSLFGQGVTPRQELETTQAQLAVAQADAQRAASVARGARVNGDGRSISVVSPISGTLTAQSTTLGGFVQPQTELFRVAGAGQVRVEVSVGAADISRVAAGDKASIVTAGGTPVEATVRAVTPTVSGSARSATVIVVPAVPASGLVVGEGVQVRLHMKNGGAGLVVPEDAVQNIDGRDVLFVRSKEGFRAQQVRVGIRSGGTAQILAGVEAGTPVATQNAFLIKADMIKSAEAE
jgi:cobalt-zinc-cadmium efflux system membrane fusion protein